MAKELNGFEALIKKLERAYKTLPGRVGTLAVNFSKERFKQQNWLDNTAEAWEKRRQRRRSKRREKGAILVSTGRLRRSIRKMKETPDGVMVGTDVPYAQVHNEGLKVNVDQTVKAHSRSAHSRTRNGRREQVSAHTVKSHRRRLNFKMPQRRFLGSSAALEREIEQDITKVFKQALIAK